MRLAEQVHGGFKEQKEPLEQREAQREKKKKERRQKAVRQAMNDEVVEITR